MVCSCGIVFGKPYSGLKNSHEWNDIHIPGIFPGPLIIEDLKNTVRKETDFANVLARLFRTKKIYSINDKYFADVIYHDGEEDDIITVQLNAKKNPDFKCYMQMSHDAMNSNMQEAIKKILGNREVTFNQFVPYKKFVFPKMKMLQNMNMPNWDKVKKAIYHCKDKINCFAKEVVPPYSEEALQEAPQEEQAGGKKKYRKSRRTKRRRSTNRKRHTKRRPTNRKRHTKRRR